MTLTLGSAGAVGAWPAAAASAPLDCAASSPLLVGARVGDLSFARVNEVIGPIRVTRLFYPGALPSRFSRRGVPAGVRLIVSYKTPSADTAAYASSIPASQDVELVFHHEPEGPRDFPGPPAQAGARYVAAFDEQAAAVRAANPAVKVGFIGGAYQYGGPSHGGSRGVGGHFIPDAADNYYLDSYQRGALEPAARDPRVRGFIAELTARGHRFGGFTEYGRGQSRIGASTDNVAVDQARAAVITADATWLAAQADASVWVYWYTTGRGSGLQWRFTDPASITAWTAAATTVRAARCEPTPTPPGQPSPVPTPPEQPAPTSPIAPTRQPTTFPTPQPPITVPPLPLPLPSPAPCPPFPVAPLVYLECPLPADPSGAPMGLPLLGAR